MLFSPSDWNLSEGEEQSQAFHSSMWREDKKQEV